MEAKPPWSQKCEQRKEEGREKEEEHCANQRGGMGVGNEEGFERRGLQVDAAAVSATIRMGRVSTGQEDVS